MSLKVSINATIENLEIFLKYNINDFRPFAIRVFFIYLFLKSRSIIEAFKSLRAYLKQSTHNFNPKLIINDVFELLFFL